MSPLSAYLLGIVTVPVAIGLGLLGYFLFTLFRGKPEDQERK